MGIKEKSTACVRFAAALPDAVGAGAAMDEQSHEQPLSVRMGHSHPWAHRRRVHRSRAGESAKPVLRPLRPCVGPDRNRLHRILYSRIRPALCIVPLVLPSGQPP